MRWVDRRALALLALSVCAGAGAQDKSTYGKVDTFEPGKKYTCVPTADHKGWDCSQSGKASESPKQPEPTAPPAAPPPAPAPTPSQASPPPSTIAAPPPAPPASNQRASELPRYLSAGAASGTAVPPPSPPPSAASTDTASTAATSRPEPTPERVVAPAPPPAPSAPVEAPAPPVTPVAKTPEPARAEPAPAPTPTPAPTAAPPPAPVEAAPTPVAAPAPAPSASIPAVRLSGGTTAFLALPGDQYVIELAHAASEDALGSVAAPDRGEVYKLHLRQNGADVWLLVWGTFPDVAAARAARAEITQGTPGWPRRIAPLQAEARRVGD